MGAEVLVELRSLVGDRRRDDRFGQPVVPVNAAVGEVADGIDEPEGGKFAMADPS